MTVVLISVHKTTENELHCKIMNWTSIFKNSLVLIIWNMYLIEWEEENYIFGVYKLA